MPVGETSPAFFLGVNFGRDGPVDDHCSAKGIKNSDTYTVEQRKS
jgi:hypothetical protein